MANHHNEHIPCCFNRCCGKPTMEHTEPEPSPTVSVQIPNTRCQGELDIAKLNPSSGLLTGDYQAAKIFNRLMQTKGGEGFADTLVESYTNSSIVMALLLTMTEAGNTPEPIGGTIWGNNEDTLELVAQLNELVIACIGSVCIFGLLFCVGLLAQLSCLPKEASKIFVIKMGPGKARLHEGLWRLACVGYLASIFLQTSLVLPAWATWTWLGVSGTLGFQVAQFLVHGEYCVTETSHVLKNPEPYMARVPETPANAGSGITVV